MRWPISADSSIAVPSAFPERRALAESALRVAQPFEFVRRSGGQPTAHDPAGVGGARVDAFPRCHIVGELGRDLEVVEPPQRRLQPGERSYVGLGTLGRK